MSASSPLARVVALCPPPAHPLNARGDRGAARAALGWPVPDHVFEVIEAYGEVSWMDWLLVPSPFTDEGRTNLANYAPGLEGDAPAPYPLVAFSDPEEVLVFVGDDGRMSVQGHRPRDLDHRDARRTVARLARRHGPRRPASARGAVERARHRAVRAAAVDRGAAGSSYILVVPDEDAARRANLPRYPHTAASADTEIST